MKTDAYTKFLLTVIAACLVYLTFGRPRLLPSLEAQAQAGPPARVIIAGFEQDSSRNIVRLPLPIRIENVRQPVPVTIDK